MKSGFGPLVPNAIILPALAYTSVERVGPGRVVHHTGDRIVVPQGEAGAAFARLFEGSGFAVRQEVDFLTASWRKLLANAAVNPITTLTLRRVGVMREPAIRALSRGLFTETCAAGRAAGAHLTDDDIEAMVVRYDTITETSGSSMLYDRLAGRRLEHDSLTGAVVRAAERHGVPAPLNRAILALLDALDKGMRTEKVEA